MSLIIQKNQYISQDVSLQLIYIIEIDNILSCEKDYSINFHLINLYYIHVVRAHFRNF